MSSGTGDKFEGKGNELKGNLKQAAGDFTGKEEWQAEGAGDEAKGKAQGFLGDMKDKAQQIGDTIGDKIDEVRK
jgi:uncharacterized protein YjbJ (UPF0337 family)